MVVYNTIPEKITPGFWEEAFSGRLAFSGIGPFYALDLDGILAIYNLTRVEQQLSLSCLPSRCFLVMDLSGRLLDIINTDNGKNPEIITVPHHSFVLSLNDIHSCDDILEQMHIIGSERV